MLEAEIADFRKTFDRIPGVNARGPVQDESRMTDPDEAEFLRRLEEGRRSE